MRDGEIVGDYRIVHRRDFGDQTDENEVVTANISEHGMLKLCEVFPSLKQTREYGLMMQPDGTTRARPIPRPEAGIQHQGRQIHREREPYAAAA